MFIGPLVADLAFLVGLWVYTFFLPYAESLPWLAQHGLLSVIGVVIGLAGAAVWIQSAILRLGFTRITDRNIRLVLLLSAVVGVHLLGGFGLLKLMVGLPTMHGWATFAGFLFVLFNGIWLVFQFPFMAQQKKADRQHYDRLTQKIGGPHD